MTRNTLLALALAAVAAGCSVGNAPATMSEGDVKAAVEKMSPKDQIDYINRSPLTPDEKRKRIAEIEAKTGVKSDAPTAPR